MNAVYDDLLAKYGHAMYTSDLAAEMRLSPGTIRNRNAKKSLPFPTVTDGQRIRARTIDVAKWLAGDPNE